ncbi:alpha/beta-hydrolase [Coccomyxa subellipsoidea C-169]|uniref:Alpha/beta-hydrolase n=1 Tax=Coccomyxa subellipsoidea (strain C-169) TaxID=574566 RepID=I0ZAK7_COCSC|nr:alpha/beta-hydrolase [Coccomyxa subellipsoidea C-169]EIE27676.1 alpha/beta-hydrolase [Coccomyxa subellipsoidea C-169]|eukprot:XP_005652220.1 alpha/beta-hydrolase [Coccomyxa subellipsoidea C-169]
MISHHRTCLPSWCPSSRGGVLRTPRASANGASAGGSKRAVVLLPGLGNNSQDYKAMGQALEERGLIVHTAAVTRVDWLRNAAGLRQAEYWKGTLQPRPVVDWYLERVADAVSGAQKSTDGPITLLAHSAGGWLARVYLLGYGTDGIDRLVTLGSPHLAPPKDKGLVDQTRGILNWVTDNCPDNFHQHIQYVTVAGKLVKGAKLRGGGGTLAQKLVGLGYQQVCGEAEVWGDGITPLPSAHLQGAEQITLEGVYHSPLGAGAGDSRPWYGSPGVIERWIRVVYDDKELDEKYSVEIGDMVQQ